MNTYIDNCIEVITVTEPNPPQAVLTTTYLCTQDSNLRYTNNGSMETAIQKIQDCKQFTQDVINDLVKCLKYLETSTYHLHKLSSICIVSPELPTALVVIENKNCVSFQLVRYVMCVTYDKELFRSRLQQCLSVVLSGKTSRTLPLDLTNRCVTRTDVFNCMTFMNCLTYTFLSDLCKEDAISEWQAHPFRKSFKMFARSFGNSVLGLMISNMKPHTSNVLFNFIMCYINCLVFNRNRNVIYGNLFPNDAPQ